jgi:SAM-dependent methyltransferase
MNNKVDFDKHAEQYEKQLTDDLKFFGEESSYFAEYKVRILKEEIDECPGRILEFGCGIGLNLQFLISYFRNSEVTGCDISEKSIEAASKRNPKAKFFRITEGNIAGERENYDIIFISNVFHHIEPHLRADSVSLIYSMLKPGGLVYFFEHNPYNPVTRRIVNNCVWDTDAILLKPAESLELFRNAGFKVTGKKYALYFPSFLKILRPVEKGLWFVPLGGQYYITARKD